MRTLPAWSGCLTAVLASAALGAVQAGDSAAGRDTAGQCRTCHGIDGIGKMPNVPHLAGQSETYLKKALKAYRTGERSDSQMTLIAQELSDGDIEDLAAWYASIEISVDVPE